MPGRIAAEAQAVQAKKAVSWRSSRGSLTTSRASPPFLSGETAVSLGLAEIFRPVFDQAVEGFGRPRRQSQRSARWIVAIGLQVEGNGAVDRGLLLGSKVSVAAIETLARDAISEVESQYVQGLCRKIGTEIAAVAPDRTVVHQAVLQEDLLAGNDVIGREDHGTDGIDELIRNRRCVLVSLDGQQNKHGEPCHHSNQSGDPPP